MDLVTPEKVAVRAGIPTPLDPDVRAAIEEALDDALAEATVHLGRSPVPETVTQRGVVPDGRGGWLLNHEPVIDVTTVTAETNPASGALTGAYTITFRVGLDPESDRRYGRVLTRFLLWSAVANPIVRRVAQEKGVRIITSVNVEGQGVTYESGQAAAGTGVAGAPPSLADLDEWVGHTVYQAPGRGPHPIETGAAWL